MRSEIFNIQCCQYLHMTLIYLRDKIIRKGVVSDPGFVIILG